MIATTVLAHARLFISYSLPRYQISPGVTCGRFGFAATLLTAGRGAPVAAGAAAGGAAATAVAAGVFARGGASAAAVAVAEGVALL
jgi:hypothetical protein